MGPVWTPIDSPGLNVSTSGGYFMPRIRGVGTAANGPGLENPVATYVDGVYQASQLFGVGSFSDIDQLSVLKGPQGTLFGRNATGGVIQITTRAPSSELGGEVESSLDNYLTSRTSAYLTGALNDKIVSNVFAEFTTQGDGWGVNHGTGNDIHRTFYAVQFRTKTKYTADDGTTILLNVDYDNHKDNNGLNFVPVAGTKLLVPGYVPSKSPWDADNDVDAVEKFSGGGASVTIDHDLGFARLVSISAYRQLLTDLNFDPTASPIDGQDILNRQSAQEITEEIQLVSRQNRVFSWQAGIYGFYENDRVKPFQINPAGPLAPDPTSVGTIDIYTHATSKSIAAYGEATTLILPNTHLVTGLRFTYERRGFDGSETATLNNGAFLGNLPLPYVTPTITFSKLSWRFVLDHQLTPDVMIYASDNRGYKSGGYNGLDPTNPPYQPEKLDTYEAGFKGELFDKKLRLNAEAFYYKYTNIQVSRYTDTLVTYNGGKAKLYGIDIDAKAKLGRFFFAVGVEDMHSEFTSFPNAQFSIPLPTGGNELTTGNAKGNELPFTPGFSGNASATYTVPLSAGVLALNVNDYHSGSYAYESDNRFKQSPYDYLAISATFTLDGGKFSVRAFGSNLLNKAVPSLILTQNVGYIESFSSPPRTGGVEVRYKF